jgi:amphi-Trp domain-containing protein
VSDFKQEERISRQRAAERLVDIAYALTAGGSLELGGGGRRISVPVADEVLLERETSLTGGRAQVEVKLTWST